MDNFEIAQKIDKLKDELDKAVGILVEMPYPYTYSTIKKAREKIANVSAELSKLTDELNREDK